MITNPPGVSVACVSGTHSVLSNGHEINELKIHDPGKGVAEPRSPLTPSPLIFHLLIVLTRERSFMATCTQSYYDRITHQENCE